MSDIRVVLVEDHDLTRIGLTAALKQVEGIEVVGEAVNARQGLQVLAATKPDVAIVDIGLPDMDGIELIQRFRQSQQDSEDTVTKVLMLTMNKNKDAILAAFAAGADSYSIKDISLDNLVAAIRTTSEGNSWIEPTIARVVLQQVRSSTPSEPDTSPEDEVATPTREIKALDLEAQQMIETDSLTEREIEVLELIVGGCSNSQIAARLFITVGTVKTHVRNILNKLCADDRTQAAVKALRSGLVE